MYIMLLRALMCTVLLICKAVQATPPACFLSCINEVSHTCPFEHTDIHCLCIKRDSVIGCLVDICPYGNFEPARDHFLGVCLENQNNPARPPHLPPNADKATTGSGGSDNTAVKSKTDKPHHHAYTSAAESGEDTERRPSVHYKTPGQPEVLESTKAYVVEASLPRLSDSSTVSTADSLGSSRTRMRVLRSSKSNPQAEPELIYDSHDATGKYKIDAENGRSRHTRPLPPGRSLDEYAKEEKASSAINYNKRLYRNRFQ